MPTIELARSRIDADKLQREIMNLPIRSSLGSPVTQSEREWLSGYKLGHRDARHAAAELVASCSAQQGGSEAPLPELTAAGLARINEAHSYMSLPMCVGNADHETDGFKHRVYKQSIHEGCYICALLVDNLRLREALRTSPSAALAGEPKGEGNAGVREDAGVNTDGGKSNG